MPPIGRPTDVMLRGLSVGETSVSPAKADKPIDIVVVVVVTFFSFEVLSRLRPMSCNTCYMADDPTRVLLVFHHHFSANPSLPQPFLFLLQDSLYGFPRLFTLTSEHILLFTF